MNRTQARKADRIQMAAEVQALAESFGFPADIIPEGRHFPERETSVEITMQHGLRLWVDFDGRNPNGPECWVLSWHGVKPGWRLNPAAFPFDAVNPCHGHKATDVCHSYRGLMELLTARFSDIRSGFAFTPG